VMLKNAVQAGKASLGPVIPMTAAVNPAPQAPQAPQAYETSAASIASAIRQASSQRNMNF